MGQYKYEPARALFAELAERHPANADIHVNLAIAILNRQREGDEVAALAILERVLESNANHLRARYCTALLRDYLGEPERALEHFRFVAESDPDDAYAAYYFAKALAAANRHDEALTWYQRAIEADPYLRSSYNACSLLLRRMDQQQEADRLLAEFQKLEHNPRSTVVKLVYTRMGSKAEVVTVGGDPRVTPEAASGNLVAPPEGPIFAEPVPLLENGDQFTWKSRQQADRAVSVTACDIDMDGDIDAYVADVLDQENLHNAVCLNQGDGNFILDPDHVLSTVPDVNAALWGDYDNDGLTDVYLCRRGPNMLWKQIEKGVWRDMTAATGTANAAFDTVDGALADFDHDGDLDIFCVNGNGPNELLNNNLDGTFTPIAAAQGIAGAGKGARDVLVLDLDMDRDLDIVIANNDITFDVWLNDRLWAYRSGDLPASAIRPRFEDLSQELWLQDRVGHDVAIVSYDGAGPPLIRKSLPEEPPFTAIAFTGRQVTSDNRQIRSNASGIGTHYAARIGSRWVEGKTPTLQQSPGQSLQPMTISLPDRSFIDFISIYWSDGVFQSEVHNVPSVDGAPPRDFSPEHFEVIEEIERQLSSCPVIFAWNGSEYKFVTDCLGVGGLGYLVAPNEYTTPRPWENVLLPRDLLKPKDDKFIIKLTEPMEEVCYLDHVKLVAYDVPVGWNVALDERMSIAGPPPPLPTGKPLFYRLYLLPIKATNDRGEDITAAVIAADLRAAPVGELDSRFIGRLVRDHSITLEFAEPLETEITKPALVIDGWVEYPYSQTMFSAHQAKAEYKAPTLEAMGADGTWRVVYEQFGYPAGMPRQMAIPLSNLPAGTTKLRLTTNQEIYFDRIAVANTESCEHAQRHEIRLTEAKLIQSGFPARTTGPQRQPNYDYDNRKPLGDTRHQRGYYTAAGPMTELIAEIDDAVAIFGPGEEIHIEYDAASLPEIPDRPYDEESPYDTTIGKWSRIFVLEFHGWCKDMDLFTKDGETIEPLPTRGIRLDEAAAKKRSALHERFNTRYEGGR